MPRGQDDPIGIKTTDPVKARLDLVRARCLQRVRQLPHPAGRAESRFPEDVEQGDAVFHVSLSQGAQGLLLRLEGTVPAAAHALLPLGITHRF